MAIDYEKLINYKIPDIEHVYTARDTMLYALGVGLGADPTDQRELKFVYEKNLQTLPTMAVVICAPHAWLRKANVGMSGKSVHGGQSLAVHQPLPVEGTFVGEARVGGVIDKGPGKGALVITERKIYNKANGDLLCTLEATTFCRGDGGFGGPSGPADPPHSIPERKPDLSCDLAIIPQAALIYRLSGDHNPLHADPEFARKAGFAQPILHGLCTLGVAGHAILKTCCEYEPGRLRSLALRFSAPIYPGEKLRTEIWRDGTQISFRAVVPERDNTIVLNNGSATIAA